MRDRSAFLVLSFLSGQQRKSPSSASSSRISRHYSLIPQVWKFLEPIQNTLTTSKEEEEENEFQAIQHAQVSSSKDDETSTMADTRSWYRSAYPEMFLPSASEQGSSSMLWTKEESMGTVMTRSRRHSVTIGAVRPWDGTKYYSDLIMDGLDWLATPGLSSNKKNMIMMLESPTTATSIASSKKQTKSSSSSLCFTNQHKFLIHDHPVSGLQGKTVMGPLRYACMTGHAFSTFLRHPPPAGLMEHWSNAIPNYSSPTFSHSIPKKSQTICAYVPLEQFDTNGHQQQHMIDPHDHYDLGSKACIPHMTTRTTKLLPNMHAVRPCVVKVTHAMGSRGIFIIRSDADEVECVQCLQETGRPNYVITEFVKIKRSLAAHFFIHPTGDVTWFGTSENMLLCDDGSCSDDATIWSSEQQEKLQKLMMPYVRDVAQYCLSRGYWGACGIDVLLDRNGRGHVVDVNPRVTGTCPALMVFTKLCAATTSSSSPNHTFRHGTFRRSKDHAFPGSASELLRQVNEFNESNKNLRVVIFSLCQMSPSCTLLNIGVFGPNKEECDKVLNQFAPKMIEEEEEEAGHGVIMPTTKRANDNLLP